MTAAVSEQHLTLSVLAVIRKADPFLLRERLLVAASCQPCFACFLVITLTCTWQELLGDTKKSFVDWGPDPQHPKGSNPAAARLTALPVPPTHITPYRFL